MITRISFLSLFVTLCLSGCTEKESRLDAVNYTQLFDNILVDDDKLYVVNFWATWCKPCMEELPSFLELDKELRPNSHYQMILVSLDKSTSLNTSVSSVVETMNIQPDVLLLDDAKRMNEWIPAINENWDGSIPATALYRNKKQLEFHTGQLTKEELKILIDKHI
jgi:thiol-disulfide isomerase/thioredoxin